MRVSSTLVSWSNENKSCMRVDKREFAWEFHQLLCSGQTRTRVAWELTSESLYESFHQLSCPGQMRTRVAWELTSESLYESFHELSCPGQMRTRVAWELKSESLYESFHELSCPGQMRTRVAWEFHQLKMNAFQFFPHRMKWKLCYNSILWMMLWSPKTNSWGRKLKNSNQRIKAKMIMSRYLCTDPYITQGTHTWS